MNGGEEFAFFIEEMLGCAIKGFKETEQYKLLREKLDQMDRDCDSMLTPDEKEFAVKYPNCSPNNSRYQSKLSHRD